MKNKLRIFFCVLSAAIAMMSVFVHAENTVSMDMEVYEQPDGYAVDAPEKLKPGEYMVTVDVSNLQASSKYIEVYLAIKCDGRLCSVYRKTQDIKGNVTAKKFYTVEIPVKINDSGKLAIEAYCWNDNMTPFSDKLTFGDAKLERYSAYGRIIATYRNDNALKPNEVEFRVEKSDNFDGEKIPNDYPFVVWKLKYMGDNPEELLFRYAKTEVIKDENDNFTLASIESVSDNGVYVTSADLIDSYNGTQISFFNDEYRRKTTSYRLADSVQVYVNGVNIYGSIDNAISDYILNSEGGKVILVDETEMGTADFDGKIDYIFIEYRGDAVVNCVSPSDGAYKVYFDYTSLNIKSSMKIDLTDSDIDVRYILNGKEIEYTDLKAGDVLSIAYDVTSNFDGSVFYDVLVSREFVTGMVSASRINEYTGRTEYMVNGKGYSFRSDFGDMLTLGTTYKLYLNSYGKICGYEEITDNANVGIFDSAEIDKSGTPIIRIINEEGKKVPYPVMGGDKSRYTELARIGYSTDAAWNTDEGKFAADSYKKPVEQRIVTYKTNSDGYILGISVITNAKSLTDAEYKKSTSRIGSVSFSENSKIICITESSSDFSSIKGIRDVRADELIDGNIYSAIAAGMDNSGIYRFIVITDGDVAEREEEYTSYYGIFDRAFIDSFDTPMLNIITANGSKKGYSIRNDNLKEYKRLAKIGYSDDAEGNTSAGLYAPDSDRKPIEQRMIRYDVDSSGYISSVSVLEDAAVVNSVYNAENMTIGDVSLAAGSTFIDLTSDIVGKASADLFENGAEYTIIAAGFENGAYSILAVTDGELKTYEYVGIFDKAYADSYYNYKISIITADGRKVSYPVRSSQYERLARVGYNPDAPIMRYGEYSDSSERLPIEKRIVTYAVDSSGYITQVISFNAGDRVICEYNKELDAFGDMKIGNDAVILDLSYNSNDFTDISTIYKIDSDKLKNMEDYELAGVDTDEDGSYDFIAILKGTRAYNADTPICVYFDMGMIYDEQLGDSVEVIRAYSEGELKEIKLSPYSNYYQLKKGDVFVVFDEDYDGYADEVKTIFSGIKYSYESFMDNIKGISAVTQHGKYIWNGITDMPFDWLDTTSETKSGNVEILFGVITDKSGNNIAVSQISNDLVDVYSGGEYTVLNNANIYVYDFGDYNYDRPTIGDLSSIKKSFVPDSQYVSDSEFSIYEYNDLYRELHFIFAKLVDGDIAECMVINGAV